MISAVRGTRDILPGEVERWQRVEVIARRVCERYGYAEVRTPILEREELFSKGTGESTDIVQKEMYSFTDKGGEQVTMRPEATPSMVRALIEHNLAQVMAVPKLYAIGPMFRYERPQKGRYRQFHQLDVEVFGIEDPGIDAEVVEMAWTLVQELGVTPVELVMNSVGCPECRPGFSEALLRAVGTDLGKLCHDCQRRAATNPLRIFDCKVPADQAIIDALPHTVDYLCQACRTHFAEVRSYLDGLGIPYRLSHRLVRGLDYYTRTTFEVLVADLGAQNAVLGGGRYDGLVKQLGGPDYAGIGFAAGLERLVLALPADVELNGHSPIVVATAGEETRREAVVLLRELRQAGLTGHMAYEARSLRAQFKRAARLGAAYVVIVGGDELARGEVTVKHMAGGEQQSVARGEIVAWLQHAVAVGSPPTR